MIANIKLGMQGWNHQEWVGRSYPTSISPSEWLGHYSSCFPIVEVDDTFYGIPPEPLVSQWRDSVESGFLFSPKVPQQISHEQRFAGGEGLLKRFLDRISLLEETLGPLLLVAPPGFLPDDEGKATLRRLVDRLPSEFNWALELKSAAWCTDETHNLLASRNVALVIGANRWIRQSRMLRLAETPTADFVYVRWNNTSGGKALPTEPADAEKPAAVWEEPLIRLCGLVGSVYGYFHLNAFGDGLRSANELQYSIDQRRPEKSVLKG